MKKLLSPILLALVFTSCQWRSAWTDCNAWLAPDQPTQNNLVDIFYIVSTNVLTESNSYYAVLSEEERQNMTAEMEYVRNAMGDSVNFFAPYYHQLTLDGFVDTDSVDLRLQPAIQEVESAFNYYITRLNPHRPFVLMGFSQGAVIALELTKHLTPEQQSRLVATYMLGYRLSEEDLQNANIRPAHDATERGVTVSFNTVADTTAVWHYISDHAATAINPINWTTDATEATLVFAGDTSVLRLDTTRNILIAPSIPEEKYYKEIFDPFCKTGNLHLGDLLFYLPSISENIHQRMKK